MDWPTTRVAASSSVWRIFSPPGTSPTPVLPLLSVRMTMLRVKNGAWAPLRFISMPSWPATGMTRKAVTVGAPRTAPDSVGVMVSLLCGALEGMGGWRPYTSDIIQLNRVGLGLSEAVFAVGQVRAHGRAGGISVLVADGVEDVFVLAVHPAQVVQTPLGRADGGVDPGARNDHGAQVSHQVGKVAVAGGLGHFHMEAEVRGHGVRVFQNGGLEGIEHGLHGLQIRLGAALGGQAGGLSLQ